jgi:hypothetical protein
MKQPDVTPISHEKYRYRLDEDYTVTIFFRKSPYLLTIPAGFLFDGTSNPQIFWSISGITPDGILRAATVPHDYIYDLKGEVIVTNKDVQYPIKLSRSEADHVFLDHMDMSQVPKAKRNKAYLGVRLGGWLYWIKKRKPIPMDASFERTKWWPKDVELIGFHGA